jgi:hypothetical protein
MVSDMLARREGIPTTFSRLLSRLAGLSLVPTSQPRVWESRSPPFTSGFKSLAFRAPTTSSFPLSIFAIRGVHFSSRMSRPRISHHTRYGHFASRPNLRQFDIRRMTSPSLSACRHVFSRLALHTAVLPQPAPIFNHLRQ